MIEKVCDFWFKIKCPYCRKEYVNPNQWLNCDCGATIRITWKAIARQMQSLYSDERKERKENDSQPKGI